MGAIERHARYFYWHSLTPSLFMGVYSTHIFIYDRCCCVAYLLFVQVNVYMRLPFDYNLSFASTNDCPFSCSTLYVWLVFLSSVIFPVSTFTAACIRSARASISLSVCFSRSGMESSIPTPTPGGIHRPTSFANTLDGECIPRAPFTPSTIPEKKLLT